MKSQKSNPIYCIILFLFSISLLGCDNFLDGADLKNKIEKEIALNTAENYKVILTPGQTESGYFLDGVKELKVGVPTEIQFSLNNNYSFDEIYAIDSSSGRLLDDCFDFSLLSKDMGIYKYQIELLKPAKNITIIARCSLKSDTKKPEIDFINIYNTPDKNHTYYHQLTDKLYTQSQWGDSGDEKEENFHKNHAASLYIEASGIDTDSGIFTIGIKETYLRDTTDSTVPKEEYINYFGVTDNISDFELKNKSNYSYYHDFTYTFKSSGNGLVSLEMFFVDKAGNKGESKTFEVIKDTNAKDISKIFTDFSLTNIPESTFNNLTKKYESDFSFSSFAFNEEQFYLSCTKSRYYSLSLKNISDSEYTSIISKKEHKTPNQENDFITSEILNSGFKRNVDEDLYAKFDIWLENGLYEEIEYIIPKRTQLMTCREFSDGADNVVELLFSGKGDYVLTYYNRIVYTFQKTESDEPTALAYADSTLNPNYTSSIKKAFFEQNGNGIYTFYPVSTLSNNNTSLDSPLGRPYVYYYKTENINPTAPFPDFSVDETAIEFPVNSGKVLIKVDVEFPVNDFIYYIKALDSRTGSYIPKLSDSKTVTADNGCDYTISLVAYTKDGIYAGESEKKITLVLQRIDNYPPVSISDKTPIKYETPEGIIYSGKFYDTDKDFHIKYDINELEFYFVPREYGSTLTEDFVKQNFPVIKKSYNNETYGISDYYLPYDGLSDGKYYLYIKNTDNSEYKNTLFQAIDIASYSGVKFDVKKVILNETPAIEYKNDTFYISIPTYNKDIHDRIKNKFFTGISYSEYPAKLTCYTLGSDLQWKSKLSFADMTADSPTKKSNYSLDKTTIGSETSFIKIYSSYLYKYTYASASIKYPCFYLPVYICPKYYFDKLECDSCDWLRTENGLQIFCDAPCFVHTMYCSKKLTEGTGELDAAIWEANGQETGIMVKDRNFTYKNTNFDGIEKGKFYTTIMHFADGTVRMTEPRVK